MVRRVVGDPERASAPPAPPSRAESELSPPHHGRRRRHMDRLAAGKDRSVADRMQRHCAACEQLVTEVEALLYRHDPVGIAFGDNPDEYRPEASSIAGWLHRAGSVDDVRTLVRGALARWVGGGRPGDTERFDGIARDLWALGRGRPQQHA